MLRNPRTAPVPELQRLRQWATARGVAIATTHYDGLWAMTVQVVMPVTFTAVAAEQLSPEAAAGDIIRQLEAIGEEVR
jgi:hypothetical protein